MAAAAVAQPLATAIAEPSPDLRTFHVAPAAAAAAATPAAVASPAAATAPARSGPSLSEFFAKAAQTKHVSAAPSGSELYDDAYDERPRRRGDARSRSSGLRAAAAAAAARRVAHRDEDDDEEEENEENEDNDNDSEDGHGNEDDYNELVLGDNDEDNEDIDEDIEEEVDEDEEEERQILADIEQRAAAGASAADDPAPGQLASAGSHPTRNLIFANPPAKGGFHHMTLLAEIVIPGAEAFNLAKTLEDLKSEKYQFHLDEAHRPCATFGKGNLFIESCSNQADRLAILDGRPLHVVVVDVEKHVLRNQFQRDLYVDLPQIHALNPDAYPDHIRVLATGNHVQVTPEHLFTTHDFDPEADSGDDDGEERVEEEEEQEQEDNGDGMFSSPSAKPAAQRFTAEELRTYAGNSVIANGLRMHVATREANSKEVHPVAQVLHALYRASSSNPRVRDAEGPYADIPRSFEVAMPRWNRMVDEYASEVATAEREKIAEVLADDRFDLGKLKVCAAFPGHLQEMAGVGSGTSEFARLRAIVQHHNMNDSASFLTFTFKIRYRHVM